MKKEEEFEELLERLDDSSKEFTFPAGYTPDDAKEFVNPWGFVPGKLFIAGQNARGSLYETNTDRQQWTQEHLILRSSVADITFKANALS